MPDLLAAAVAVLLAFLGCYATLAYLLGNQHLVPLDLPNERSLHARPKPRIGGLGIAVGLAIAVLLIRPIGLSWLVCAAVCLMLVSLLDDYRGLAPLTRLVAHLVAALVFLVTNGLFSQPGLLIALPLLAWMTNLYNFMDGADGLAGGMAVLGFSSYAALAGLAGDPELTWFALAVAAASLAFLAFNLPPSRLFMGDAGSITLGFLAGAIGILGWQRGLWPWVMPIIAFSPFIVDASITLARRTRRGEKIWMAHREHYYQRLVRMGWSHGRLAAAAYALMFATSGTTVLLAVYPRLLWPFLVGWCLAYGLILALIDRRWRQHEHAA